MSSPSTPTPKRVQNYQGRLIAIGDIHGHSNALDSLIRAINPSAKDEIITLGDYVNRGPGSEGVIEQLIELQDRCQLISILGNHDEMLLDARKDQYAFDRFVMSGGKETVQSYRSQKLDAIPDAHWEFLESCRDYHETSNFIFTHANACSHTPMNDQLSSVLRWTGVDEMEICNHRTGKSLVVGHAAGEEIRNFGTCVCIDTGCGFGGVLTAYEPATKKRWQVTEDGRHVN
ncbi:metallophosphoesterase family protein [Rhodopirellula bahusiensis]|uniref:Serine/threonine protein phosphatase n=1 Tax=Rhodopirellula bahusiensis TaxID=2014065 RepID=A0A2G1W5S7_9BACT|nr:metallophosphoesterase family protein [Rhodopirellula bahusiensis]PHQ34375.1 serine/threonine protein phosphatase [Rhodopirellula bahusiensis]